MTLYNQWLWHAWTPPRYRYVNHIPYSQPQALLKCTLETDLWNLNDALIQITTNYSWKHRPSEIWNLNRKCKSHSHFLTGAQGTHVEECLRESNAHSRDPLYQNSTFLTEYYPWFEERKRKRLLFSTVRFPCCIWSNLQQFHLHQFCQHISTKCN